MQLVAYYCLSVILAVDYTWSFPTHDITVNNDKYYSVQYITTEYVFCKYTFHVADTVAQEIAH